MVGVMRDSTWAFVVTSTWCGDTAPTITPVPMAITMPASETNAARRNRRSQPIVADSAIPSSGVMSGAISIAPMTTAVDWATTPIEAMTDAKAMSTAKRPKRTGASSPSKNTLACKVSRVSAMSG